MADREALVQLAAALADGTPVDWNDAESSAADEAAHGVVRQLRLVAELRAAQRVAASHARPALGQWGHLRRLARVAGGAFGEVYRAWDTRLDREVALKLLRQPEGSDALAVSSVVEEGRLLARVRHPNVVAVYGAERVHDRVGIWMEFIRGRTLEAAVVENGPFGAHEAALIGRDLCRALAAVHAAGLVHRDVKAQNVMREEGGRLVLMDFGTSRETALDETDASHDLTGTPLYLAPELFQGGDATPRSDIYSLGVLLYHLVTGGFPVEGRTLDEVRRAHARGDRKLLRDARPDLPERFVQVVERALAANAESRFESAGATEAALTAALTPLAPAPSSTPDAPPLPIAPRRRHTGWLALAAAGFALGGLLVVANVGQVRSRLLGGSGSGGGVQTHPAAADVASSEVAIRRVAFPDDYLAAGRPSPDGRFFSYTDNDGDLALVELATGKTRKVTNKGNSTETAHAAMAVSADGKWIAYSWYALDGACEMRVIRTDGREPRVLVRRADIEMPLPYEWSGDNTQVLALIVLKDRTNAIALVRVADGNVRIVKNVGSNSPQSISLSRDGRFIVYDLPQRADSPERDIHVIDVETRREWPLVEGASNDVYPMWAPDGEGVVFISDRSVGLSLFEVPVLDGRASGEPILLQRSLGRIMPMGITRIGAFFYRVQTGMVDVYTADIDFAANRVGTPKAVSSGIVGSNISSDWSPDGRYLAFVTTRGLVAADRYSRTLAIRDMETGAHRELMPPLAFFIGPRWSPDGRAIAVKGDDLKGRWGTHLVDVATGRVQPAVVAEPNNDSDYGAHRWAPDGHLLYEHAPRGVVSRNLASGEESLFLAYAEAGVKRLGAFKISPDRRSLAFSGGFREEDTWTTVLRVQPLGGAPTELVRAKPPQAVVLAGWTPDGKELMFVRNPGKPDEPFTLWRVPIIGGEPRSLGLSIPALRDVSVHPDGTRLTFTAGSPTWDMWVMEQALKPAAQ